MGGGAWSEVTTSTCNTITSFCGALAAPTRSRICKCCALAAIRGKAIGMSTESTDIRENKSRAINVDSFPDS